MTSLPITPPSAARVGTALKGASPPSGPTGDFAALLTQTSARTAPAEGPKTRPAQPRRDERDAPARKDGAEAAQDPQATAAAQAPAPAPAPATPQAPADGASGDGAQGQQPQGDAAPADPQATPAVPAPTAAQAAATVAAAAAVGAAVAPAAVAATTTAQATPAQPATATAQTLAAATAQPGSAVDPDAKPVDPDATPTAGAPAGKLQIPAELLGAKGDHPKNAKDGDAPKRELPPAPTLPPAPAPGQSPATVAGQGAVVPDGGQSLVAGQAVAGPPVAAPPAAAPQTAGWAGAGAPQLTRASVLQTAERVQELVRIATTRAGNARATLQLRPAELGQVDVHLRTTRNGLVATIAAHDQVGLDALQQAGNELRRSLEDKGVQLHSLDLQLGAGQHGFANQGDARQASSGQRGAASSHGLGAEDEEIDHDLTITTATSTPAGALVDVQA